MKKQIVNIVSVLIIVLTLFGSNTQSVGASAPQTVLTVLPNPGTMIPVPAGKYAKYSQGPHLSGFPASWGITNPKIVTSSIDLGYSGTVVAPLSGYLAIMKNCGDHQVAVIRASSGWAIALVHIYVNSDVRNKSVGKGQVIGKTVPPLPSPGKGCGYGKGSHIHYTLMKWKQSSTIQYTEQNIVNTYIASWIVKNTYLQGSAHNIPIGSVIK